MLLRTSHFEMLSSGNEEQDRADIATLFDHALERRHAWVTGLVVGVDTTEVVNYARSRRYRPWAPQIVANDVSRRTDCFIAVRGDLVEGVMEKYVSLAHLGEDQVSTLGFDAPSGFLDAAFRATRKDLGWVRVGTCPSMNDEVRDEIASWYDLAANDWDLAFFGGPPHNGEGYPSYFSRNDRVTIEIDTTNPVVFQAEGVNYRESTFNVLPITQ